MRTNGAAQCEFHYGYARSRCGISSGSRRWTTQRNTLGRGFSGSRTSDGVDSGIGVDGISSTTRTSSGDTPWALDLAHSIPVGRSTTRRRNPPLASVTVSRSGNPARVFSRHSIRKSPTRIISPAVSIFGFGGGGAISSEVFSEKPASGLFERMIFSEMSCAKNSNSEKF